MYITTVVALLFILPVTSIVLDAVERHHDVLQAATVGKWFVFWAVGVRLLLAGLRQIAQPRYTAEIILGVKDPGARLIVRELGFANTAIGCAGLGCILLSGWILPVAVIGAIFYGLAGINHAAHGSRNTLRNVAMASDFFAAAVLAAFCWATAMSVAGSAPISP